ncbi:glucan 1,3-beta-glucosidase, partial [Phenoliferia sp. Uapishka_3]
MSASEPTIRLVPSRDASRSPTPRNASPPRVSDTSSAEGRYAALPLTEEPFLPPTHRHSSNSSTPEEAAPMLSPPPGSPGIPSNRASNSPSSLGSYPDPYQMYSAGSEQSSFNFSLGGDGDSSRPMNARRGSNLPDLGSGEGRRSGLGQYASGGGADEFAEKDEESGRGLAGRKEGNFYTRMSSRGRRILFAGIIIAIIVIAVAAAVPSALSNKSNKSVKAAAATGSSSSSSGTGTATSSAATATSTGFDWKTAATGGDGSTVFTEDGSSFVYNNTFGGFWVSVPFNDTARAQNDVPALDQTWDYSVNMISGVNLGGWLMLEPFITPALFEPFNSITDSPTATNGAVDEWTLSVALGNNLSTVLTNHYATFITEKDFAEIAAAGLNWVRIPIPYWIIEVQSGEPFLANVGWTYLLKAIEWARKYGIRINLDLHAVPGSQNGYNHSSKLGTINFLAGVMGVANAQRTLNYIRTLAEFISQPQYANVVAMFSVLNEPRAAIIGIDSVRSFYLEAYETVRAITGIGEGKGPFISYHDGFVSQAKTVAQGGWMGFMNGADRIAIDSHPYLCFDTQNNDPLSYQASKPCTNWAVDMNTSTAEFGLTIAGEWALAINDCGKWINNVGNGRRFDGTWYAPSNFDASVVTETTPTFEAVGSCTEWDEWWNYNASTKAGLQNVAYAHMDALRHWFFWTWKTGYSDVKQAIVNPLWNYQLALQEGFAPKNPRLGRGACATLVPAAGTTLSSVAAPTLSNWMTGGSGAGTITSTSTWGTWPPASLVNSMASGVFSTYHASVLPTLTATGPVITMSAATPTSYPSGYSSSSNPGNGWFDASDTAAWYTTVSGCSYPNAWSGISAVVPTAACTGGAAREKRAPSPMVTPPPSPRW